VNPEKLLGLLADRLGRIVPEGFGVEIDGGLLWYTEDGVRRSGTYIVSNLPAFGDSIDVRVAGVARQALDELQDAVDEATADPWPGARNPPRAYALVEDGKLHMWYGEPPDVALACEPILLSDLE